MSTKDPYRRSSEKRVPVSWPYTTSPASNETRLVTESLKTQYTGILEKLNIPFKGSTAAALPHKGHNNPRETLIIHTDDDIAKDWSLAATQIQEKVDGMLSKRNANLKIDVEIRHGEKSYQDVSSIIQPDSSEYHAVMGIKNAVIEHVKKTSRGLWTSISFLMRGKRDGGEKTATVFITVVPDFKYLWEHVEKEIAELIKNQNNTSIEIAVEIVPGNTYLLTPPFVSEDMKPAPSKAWELLDIPPRIGSSVGPRNSRDTGSIGVWVHFQAKVI